MLKSVQSENKLDPYKEILILALDYILFCQTTIICAGRWRPPDYSYHSECCQVWSYHIERPDLRIALSLQLQDYNKQW